MSNLALVTTCIIAVYALFRAIREFLISRDIGVASKKITLLDTIIEAKNIDIAKDEQDVKEKSDVYEGIKRNRNDTNH